MFYTINQLAKLAKISTRTLRHYDEIGLLVPSRKAENDYRIYGEKEVDLLQQIMFFRELGMRLADIKAVICEADFDLVSALQTHLGTLENEHERLDLLIKNVKKTIEKERGKRTMSNSEKFEGFKRKMVDDNEKEYGDEIRKKYGDEVVDASNEKLLAMSKDDFASIEALTVELNNHLKIATEAGDPSSDIAQKTCKLHEKWLRFYWKKYSKEAHLSLAHTYVSDARFKKYYEDITPGCAEFLLAALEIYLN